MNVVGNVRTDICGESSHQIPRLLWIGGLGSWHAKFIARKETPNVDLIDRGTSQLEVAIGRHEMPLGTEVVIQARHSEVGSLRDPDIGRETQNIDPVATGASGARCVRRWFKLPELLQD